MIKALKYIFFTFIFSTIVFAKNSDREIIKAYEKGKPAEMLIEVTKVKSDNYFDLTIDKTNKKIYKDITRDISNSEIKDLKGRLYITDYIDKIDSTDDIINMYPNKIITVNDKKYLEIDYSHYSEPKTLYFWILKGKNVKKLYTGRITDEYFDLTKPEGHIIFENIDNEKDKIYKLKKDKVILKIAKISHRKESDQNIILDTGNISYFLEGKEFKEKIPINLVFENNKKRTNINKKHTQDTLYGIIEDNLNINLESKEYILKSERSQELNYPIEISFSNTPALLFRSLDTDNYFKGFYSFEPYSSLYDHDGKIKVYAKTLTNDIVYIKTFLWWGYIENHLPSSEITQEDAFFGSRIFNNNTYKQIIFYKGNKIVNQGRRVKDYNDLNLTDGGDSIRYSFSENKILIVVNRKDYGDNRIDKIVTEFSSYWLPDTIFEISFTEDPKPDLLVNVLQEFDFGTVHNGEIGKSAAAELSVEYNKNYDCVIKTEDTIQMNYITSNGNIYDNRSVTSEITGVKLKQTTSLDDKYQKSNYLINSKILNYKNIIPGDYRGTTNITVTLKEKTKDGKF